MEPITEPEINLFANELPSMEDIEKLACYVHSREANQIKFAEQLKANIARTSPKAQLAAGIGLFITGRNAEAIEKLQKANDCKEKFTYLAFALRRTGKFDETIENLQKNLKYEADTLNITLEKAATHRCAENLDAAANELKAVQILKMLVPNTITNWADFKKPSAFMNKRWTITKQHWN